LLSNIDFCSLSKKYDLRFRFEAKRTEKGAIWSLIVLEVIIARLGIIAKSKQVVTALRREGACKISNVLLLE